MSLFLPLILPEVHKDPPPEGSYQTRPVQSGIQSVIGPFST